MAKTFLIQDFIESLPFSVDPFQTQAFEAVERNKNVLVAAPTGSGKTLVAEFAVYMALSEQKKIFYTTPIKALSNQKFADLGERFGTENVGLLTGDSVINPQAHIIVMTTEVLRNMIYAESELLPDLGWVVMDEIHYLADKFRGAVWEEILIHLEQRIKIIALSATISNVGEFADWIMSLRGETVTILSQKRPVPLEQHLLVKGQLVPLFFRSNTKRLNNALFRLTASSRAGHKRGRNIRFSRQPSRISIVEQLRKEDLLPAIVFIFSRAGCEDAAEQLLDGGVDLLSPDEKRQVHDYVSEAVKRISREDLDTLNYWKWLAFLTRGIATHHAGMLPLFKEVVEKLFEKKLLRVVFATETLALGVNMPARTVVLEKIEKFNGETRARITSGEYTQLTGRAGRRGIDTLGHSVIVWHDAMNLHDIGNMAGRQYFPLISSFRPGYNMSVHLLERFGEDAAREILEKSFAQFQADRKVVDMAQKVHDMEHSLDGYRKAMHCDQGDFFEYSQLRHELSTLEKARTRGWSAKRLDKRQHEIELLRLSLRNHPANTCPDRENHSRWGERYWKIHKEVSTLRQHIAQRTGKIVDSFHKINRVLEELEYVSRDESGQLQITAAGSILKNIYCERDLLIAEAIRKGTWSNLGAADLAAMVSVMVFEPRGDDDPYQEYRIPQGVFSAAFEETVELWETIGHVEQSAGLPSGNQLSASFVMTVYRWATGTHIDKILPKAGMSAGDFVRGIKQIVDVLDQLHKANIGQISSTAAHAKELIFKGIVAYSAHE